MEMNDIKVEDDEDKLSLCFACLSSSRRLKPISEHEDIFTKIMADFLYEVPLPLRRQTMICWECRALLNKAKEFEVKFKKSCIYFQNRLKYLNSLSNLGTITIDSQNNDIYIYDTKDEIIDDNLCIKSENKSDDEIYGEETVLVEEFKTEIDKDENEIEKSDEELYGEETVYVAELQTEIEIDENQIELNNITKNIDTNGVTIKKEKKKTEKRDCITINKEIDFKKTIIEKVQKFDVITNCELAVKRVQIDDSEFDKCIQKERDSEYYNSFEYKCPDCVKGFKFERLLRFHIKNCHKNEGNIVCNKCNQRFSSRNLYSEHIEQHKYIYVCKVCLYESCHREEVREHVEDHTIILQCKVCMLMYGSRKEFYSHYKDMHERYICDECGFTRMKRHTLEYHMKMIHTRIVCKLCNNTYKNRQSYYSHKNNKHNKNPYRLKVKRVKGKLVRTNHTPIACKLCNNTYKTRKSYYAHKNYKHNKNPYRLKVKQIREIERTPCPDCSKIFTRKAHMVDHYKCVHLKSDEFKCDICPRRCMNKSDLARHKQRIHEGIKPARNRMCNICGKSFYNIVILRNHMRTHTGDKPHSCPVCPAKFAQIGSARLHFKTRHKDVDMNDFNGDRELLKRLWSKDCDTN